MTLKRPRASPQAAEEDAGDGAILQELPPSKKARLDTPSLTLPIPAQRDRISALSDELLVRILSLLNVPQLLDVSLVSHRFGRLACDSQLWKALYYTRFVLPRALRIPGFRADWKTKTAPRQQHKLHYTGRRALWADGRRGGIVRDHHLEADAQQQHAKGQLAKKTTSAQDNTKVQEQPVDWKRQFRLRHNWAKGKCAVEELRLGDGSAAGNDKQTHPRMLVKVVEGIAVTADAESGLRAWDLETREIMAQMSLQPSVTAVAAHNTNDTGGKPSCLAVDDDQAPDSQTLRIALGFCDGGFGVWTLDIKRGGEKSVLELQYRHEPSSSGRLASMAYSHPFLLTATESVLVSLYIFEGPSGDVDADSSGAEASSNKWPSPHLLTSLKSHTSEPPLALSVRKAGATTTIASIAYTLATRQGWSIGVQDLHIKTPTTATSRQLPEIGSTRLAYTQPVSTAGSRPRRQQRITPPSSSDDDMPAAHDQNSGPTALSYTHPYLLATLPDNTLVLHLVTSSTASLALSRGIRLWGHTSGISDAEVTARGRAVSVSARGDEMRVWELEGSGRGRSGGRGGRDSSSSSSNKGIADGGILSSVEVRAASTASASAWEDRRDWVGFDDEMVIVLKERADGGDSLMVYDFT